jgi:Bacterial Ig-like domain (group 3)
MIRRAARARTVAPVLIALAAASGAFASQASASYTRVCSLPQPGQFECLALLRTDIPAVSRAHIADSEPVGYGYGPASLQSAYNLASAAADGGGGATVAVVDAYDDPDAGSDLAAYRSAWGLPACTTSSGCFQKLNQDGQTSPLPDAAGSTGWDLEESLDIDMISAICPNCHIILVEANSPSDANLGTGVNAAVAAGAQYVSNSYGSSEYSGESSLDADYYDHPGVVITASAGDDGYGVEYPAASRYVTAVGGTSLQPASNSRGWTETVWGSSSGDDGTGSGCSEYESKPSFQTDAGCSRRTDNDVAAVADPNTGVAVYDSYSEGGWVEVGGTSASSPIIASVYALAGPPATGTYPNSYPYGHQASLYNVSSGADGTCSPAYLCTGGAGYNGPTGLGTPDGVDGFSSGAATTTALTSSASNAVVGEAVTFTATVSGADGTPTGTVTFKDGNTQLGSPVAVSGGQAALTTGSLRAGDHSVTAQYSGDGTYSGSYSSALEEVVAGPPSASIATPASGNTYPLGQSVRTSFSCSENAYGPGLDSCDDSRGTDGASGGTGTLDTSSLGPHTYTVTATSADGESSSASISYSVVEPTATASSAKARTRITAATASASSLSATLERSGSHARLSGQTLVFSLGKHTLCQAMTNSRGTATCKPLSAVLSAVLNLGYKVSFAGTGTRRGSTSQGSVLALCAKLVGEDSSAAKAQLEHRRALLLSKLHAIGQKQLMAELRRLRRR